MKQAIYCQFCGYDLRGTADRTRCPECGTLVTLSKHEMDKRLLTEAQTRFMLVGLIVLHAIVAVGPLIYHIDDVAGADRFARDLLAAARAALVCFFMPLMAGTTLLSVILFCVNWYATRRICWWGLGAPVSGLVAFVLCLLMGWVG